jgi:hypothetical protein
MSRTVIFLGALAILVVFGIVNSLINPPPPPVPETPAQVAARVEAAQRLETEQAEQAVKHREQSHYKDELCHIKQVCSVYRTARQDCAVAGDFDNCVRVKIGEKDTVEMSLCTRDGEINSKQYVSDMPNAIECAARNAGLYK